MKIANPTAVLGENLATDYLKKHSYKILDRNFRKNYGEIGTVAVDQSEKEPVLAFVEVKTRTSTTYGIALEAIAYWKLQSLRKIAEYYKITHGHLPDAMRIDAIAVTLGKDNTVHSIELIKNIS